jgi:hypothetical protein
MPGMSVAVDVDLGHDRDHGTRDVVDRLLGGARGIRTLGRFERMVNFAKEPYGGYKESSIGREFSLEDMLDSFTQRKNVTAPGLGEITCIWL